MNYLKRNLFVMMAIAAAATMAHAQMDSEAALNAEVDAEIDRMAAPQASSQGQVITQNIVVSKAVQKQPVTLIEASPLSSSNAESIRKNRQDEELRTESRIVEKLELSRMEDEKRRAQVLFGDKFDTLNNREQVQAQAIQPAAPVIAPSSNVQAQPIMVQQNEGLTRDAVHEEVRAALEESKTKVEDTEETSLFERKYVSLSAGMPMYADLNSVKGQYSMGLSLGTSNDYFEVEGGFIYSSYKINNAAFYYPVGFGQQAVGYANFLMNQYQTYAAAKFIILNGTIRPSIGGLVSYSYRAYSLDSVYGSYAATTPGNTSAIDLGVNAGIDVAVNRRVSLGVDFKYMFNVSTSIDGDTVAGYKNPERSSYYLIGAAAKFSF